MNEKGDLLPYLSKREQQIMDVAYERGLVTAAELTTALPGEPSNSTVRTLLRILEQKGHMMHVAQGGKFHYRPTTERPAAGKVALSHVTSTFFSGSVVHAIGTLLADRGTNLSLEEVDELEGMVAQVREACSLR